jgi:hypothetical protein
VSRSRSPALKAVQNAPTTLGVVVVGCGSADASLPRPRCSAALTAPVVVPSAAAMSSSGVFQHQGHALVRRKTPQHGAGELPSLLAVARAFVARDGVVRSLYEDLTIMALSIDPGVGRNAKQPSSRFLYLLPILTAERHERSHQGFLNQVFGVPGARREAAAESIQLRPQRRQRASQLEPRAPRRLGELARSGTGCGFIRHRSARLVDHRAAG